MTTVLPTGTPVVYDGYTGQPMPMADAIGDWWTCPDWCDPIHCYGGDTFRGITLARIHTAVHYATSGTNPDQPARTTTVELVTVQAEDVDDGYSPAETVLRVGSHAITADLARGLAVTLAALAAL